MVQRYVFEKLEDPRLHAFVVWGPMLGKEERADAVGATRFLEDPRTTHLWTPVHDMADALEPVAGLPEGERAWDTFLLFAPGQTWGEEPPEPRMVQHVGKPLPDEQKLHGPTLREEIERMLAAAPPAGSTGESVSATAAGGDSE